VMIQSYTDSVANIIPLLLEVRVDTGFDLYPETHNLWISKGNDLRANDATDAL
jgi:hypothetical protein